LLKCTGSYTHLFAFKKRLSVSLGTTSMLGYILGMAPLCPDSFLFSPQLGMMLNLYPRLGTKKNNNKEGFF